MGMISRPWLTRSEKAGRAALWIVAGLVFVFLTAPILAILPLSFNAGSFLSYPLAGFSMRWYAELFASAEWRAAFHNSLLVAAATTAVATPVGTLAAIGLARLSAVEKPAVLAVLASPMVAPTIVFAVAVYFLYAPLGLTNTYLGLVLAHTVLATPFVVIVVHAALQGFEVTLLRAASSLGASPRIVAVRVLVPLIAPGVTAGAVFAFMTSFDEIVVALFVAGPAHRTLPLQMFDGVREQVSPEIAAAATLLAVTSIVLLGTLQVLRRRNRRLFSGH